MVSKEAPEPSSDGTATGIAASSGEGGTPHLGVTGLIHTNAIDPPREWRERTALITARRRLTFDELSAEVRSFSSWLRENGCRPGDRVAVYLPRGAEVTIAALAVMAAGGVFAAFDPRAPAERAKQILDLAEPQRLVTTERLAAELRAFAPAAELPPITALPNACDGHGLAPYAGSGTIDDVPFPDGPDTAAAILFTSGSTGLPKGSILSHRNFLSVADWSIESFGIYPDDVIGLHPPLYFAFSVAPFCAPFRIGAAVYALSDPESMFADAMAEIIQRERLTVWFAVPTALRMLVDEGALESRDLSSLRVIVYAGEVYQPQELRKLMLALPGRPVINAYGQTETNTAIYYRHLEPPPADALEMPLGHPAEHLEVRLCDEDGNEVGTDEIGQICVIGPPVMKGYWRDPERTASVRLRGREDSYLSGDFARRDASGLMQYCGRRDRRVKIKGQRIELLEVEKALFSTPGVANAFVFLDEDDSSLDPKIIAVIDGPAGQVERDAFRRCAELLPSYARPRAIHRLDEFPRLPNGKIDRLRVTEMVTAERAAVAAED
jgi:amino acid adenylation domain-containing protein